MWPFKRRSIWVVSEQCDGKGYADCPDCQAGLYHNTSIHGTKAAADADAKNMLSQSMEMQVGDLGNYKVEYECDKDGTWTAKTWVAENEQMESGWIHCVFYYEVNELKECDVCRVFSTEPHAHHKGA